MVRFLIIVLVLAASFRMTETQIIVDRMKVERVTKCMKKIIANNFKVDPLGEVALTRTYNLISPADDIQDDIFNYVYNNLHTGVMTAANEAEDRKWKKYDDLRNTTQMHSEDDKLIDVPTTFVQSHMLLIGNAKYYIIIIDGFRTYNSKIRQVVEMPSWNPRAPMLIYNSKPIHDEERMLSYPELIFRSLWKYHVLNAILLVHDWIDNSRINIYSWNPYDPPKRCGEQNQDIVKYLEVYDVCDRGELIKNNSLFIDKIPKNLMGCKIKVLGVIWRPFVNDADEESKGLDVDVIEVIAERLNFTVELHAEEDSWGDVFPNGSWYGMMGDIMEGDGEVAIGAIYPDNDVHEDFDSTHSYLQDRYVWVVPRAREVPEWENLIIVLRPNMWLASVVAYFLCTLVWYCLCQSPWEHGITIKSYVYSMMDSLCMYIGASTTSRPDSDSMKVYFCAFCLYGMVWATAYQTKLIDILTTPIYERQIKDVNELLESNLKFGGNEALKFLFNNSIDDTEDMLHSNYLELDVHNVLDHIIDSRNVSCLTSELYIQYLTSKTTHYNDNYGKPQFYVLQGAAFSFAVEIVVIKGFAFLYKFDEIISHMKSNGIIKKIYDNFSFECERRTAKLIRSGKIPQNDELALNIEHLQGAFMVLLLGSLLAIISFLGEVVLGRNNGKLKADLLSKCRKGKSFFKRGKSLANEEGNIIKTLNITKYYTRHQFIKNMHNLETLKSMDRIKRF